MYFLCIVNNTTFANSKNKKINNHNKLNTQHILCVTALPQSMTPKINSTAKFESNSTIIMIDKTNSFDIIIFESDASIVCKITFKKT